MRAVVVAITLLLLPFLAAAAPTTSPAPSPASPTTAALLARVADPAARELLGTVIEHIIHGTPRRPAEVADGEEHPSRSADAARIDELEGRVAEAERRAQAQQARITWLEEHVMMMRLSNHTTAEPTAAGSPGTPGRRLQDHDGDVGELVHIIKRSATTRRPSSAGTDEADGGGVHRILQKSAECGSLLTRLTAVRAECCDEPTEDCSSGAPAVCNAECAA
eukprot:COSAG01_NODE_21409_length_903_cov_1.789801_2_plen_220_part_01